MPTLHIDGARALRGLDLIIPADDVGTYADSLAETYEIAGGQFTLKADGIVLDRDGYIPDGAQILELIEYVPDVELEHPQPSDVEVELEDADIA
jgi:hypothetical protein